MTRPSAFPASPASRTTSHRPVLLSAFGMHVGGGLVLLESLLRQLGPHLKAAALDARLPAECRDLVGGGKAEWVPRSMRARWASLRRLARKAAPGDVLFCFNGLPPLRKSAGVRVVAYVHAPHFVGAHQGIRYGAVTALRIGIERAWLQQGLRHCDELWVQTPTMAASLQALHPTANVKVLPFVDDSLYSGLAAVPQPGPASPVDAAAARFFYPAELVGHKNHATLLQAWSLLASQGCRPVLQLTLQPAEMARLAAQRPAQAALNNVVNLGRLPRGEVLRTLQASSALLFPSRAETFGLPLLEATALGVPVIAAERDFVRDVCTPAQTFDPVSPRSIADAVLRFLGQERHRRISPLSAQDLVQALVA